MNSVADITCVMDLECRGCCAGGQQEQAGCLLGLDGSETVPDLWVYSECNASSPAWAAAVTNGEVVLDGSMGRGGMET